MIHPVFPACRPKHFSAQRRPPGVILNPEKRLPPQGKRQGEGSVLLFQRTLSFHPRTALPPQNGFFTTRPARWGQPFSSLRMTSGVAPGKGPVHPVSPGIRPTAARICPMLTRSRPPERMPGPAAAIPASREGSWGRDLMLPFQKREEPVNTARDAR